MKEVLIGGQIQQVRRECKDREMETLLSWPSPCSTFLKGTRHQKLLIGRSGLVSPADEALYPPLHVIQQVEMTTGTQRPG